MVRGKPAPLIIQANLNHARRAQDLFLHTMAERGCGLGVVAEPYAPPPPITRLGFRAGVRRGAAPLVAIVRGGDERSPPCRIGTRPALRHGMVGDYLRYSSIPPSLAENSPV